MKRIIHMSDLHVGFEDFSERFFRIIDNLIFEKGDKASEYVIVITGDLVENANNKGSYEKVKEGLNILKDSGFDRILLIPGNHDYGTGDVGNKKFVKLFKKTFYDKEESFPKIDIIDNLAFIGLDSMAEELNWYDEFFSEGELGKKQLKALDNILRKSNICNSKKRIIYLHHHPFSPRLLHQLKDSKMLKEILEGAMSRGVSIDAILYGHNHEGKAHNGKWNIPRCYDAGTATLKPRPELIKWLPWFKIKASTRVIDIENDKVENDYSIDLL